MTVKSEHIPENKKRMRMDDFIMKNVHFAVFNYKINKDNSNNTQNNIENSKQNQNNETKSYLHFRLFGE